MFEEANQNPEQSLHPIGLIHRALVGLRDESPSAKTASLPFIDGADFQAILRTDVSSASSALRKGNERRQRCLPVQSSRRCFGELQQTSAGSIPKIRSDPLDYCICIKPARQLGCVREETASDADTARDYRSLIHRGASVRKMQFVIWAPLTSP